MRGIGSFCYKILAGLLYPCSLIYGSLLRLRRYYISKYYPIYKAPLPVIAIGNIAVGGTGKTPLTSYILSLYERNGYHPCMISRGYGGKGRAYPIHIDKESTPYLVGDEPFMLSRKHPSSLCIVDPQRARAIAYALSFHPSCYVLDDAMQHIYVHRDSNVVVLTLYDILYGWNKVLPYGRWREEKHALASASVFCIRVQPEEWQEYKHAILSRLSEYQKAIYSFYLVIQGIYSLESAMLTPVHGDYSIVCGIGTPHSFYESISRYLGKAPVYTYYCHDHAQASDLYSAIASSPTTTVICTSKDAVKLAHHTYTDKHILYTETECVFGESLNTQYSFDEYCLSFLH